jgi:hypothetical protein
MGDLLAVDVGLRTGMALFRPDGKLAWYRSRKLGSTARLKKISHSLLKEIPDLACLVLEGGGPLAKIWVAEAKRREIPVKPVCAEIWRKLFLYPREQEGRGKAKRQAFKIARQVIEWSGAPRPTSLRHDTAEAILIGLWGVLELGWIKALPEGIKKNTASI